MTDELRKLAEAATPGPWRVGYASTSAKGVLMSEEVYVYAPGDRDNIAIAADIADPNTGDISEANAAYIAAADPQTVLRLLDVVDRAEQTVDRASYSTGNDFARVPREALALLRAALTSLRAGLQVEGGMK